MTERAKHIAGSLLEGKDLTSFHPANTDSIDPVDWALAFIKSGNTTPDEVLIWFENAMHNARFGFYHPDPTEDED
jgi:hypothetical protein